MLKKPKECGIFSMMLESVTMILAILSDKKLNKEILDKVYISKLNFILSITQLYCTAAPIGLALTLAPFLPFFLAMMIQATITITTTTATAIPTMTPTEKNGSLVLAARFKPVPLVKSFTFCSVNTMDLLIG